MSNPFPLPGNRPVEQLKVAELRDELRKRGLSLKGVKKDLMDRLDEVIQKEQAGFVINNDRHSVNPSEFPHDQDSVGILQNGDGMPNMNDSETTQDISFIVNNAHSYVAASDATPMFMESHKDEDRIPSMEERMVDSSEVGFGSSIEVAEGNGTVVDPADMVYEETNLLEPVLKCDNQVIENVAELGNEGIGIEEIEGVTANNELSDPNTSFPINVTEDTILPTSSGEGCAPESLTVKQKHVRAGGSLVLEPADITILAPAQDGPVAGVIGTLRQEIGVPEVTITSGVVILSEGDRDVPGASVLDDILNSACPNVVPTVDTVVNANYWPMQDVEVFKTNDLTSVSVVTCVQEAGKDLDDGALKIGISENTKEEPVEKYTSKGVFLEKCEALDAFRDGPKIPILVTLQELQVPEPEGVDVSAAHPGSLVQEEQQDIEMSEAHEDIPVKTENSDIKLSAAASEAPSCPIEIKTENIENAGTGDAENLQEIPKGGNIEDHTFDVKSGLEEAEYLVSRRPETVEIVEVKQQDTKEEYEQGRDSKRYRSEEDESDQFKQKALIVSGERGRVENRLGRHIREDASECMDKRVYRSEDGVDMHTGQKRKDDDRVARQQEPGKRMRSWNSGNQAVIESTKPLSSGTAGEIVSPEVKKGEFVVASSKRNTKLGGPSKPAPLAAKPGFVANKEERLVPVSTQPPSASLKIERFVRPFTLKAVKDLLAEFGDFVDFWIDQIKTHCYVTFSKVEEAVAARNGLYNRQWPPSFGNLLIANFVDASEVKSRSAGLFEKTIAPALAPFHYSQNHPPVLGAQRGRSNALASAPPLRERQYMQSSIKDPEPAALTLDDLFRRTKEKPYIYYLPLTDEQVAKKLAVLGTEKLLIARNNNRFVNVRPVGRL